MASSSSSNLDQVPASPYTHSEESKHLHQMKTAGRVMAGVGGVVLIGATVLATPFLSGTALAVSVPFIATVGAFVAPVASVALVVSIVAGALFSLLLGACFWGISQRSLNHLADQPTNEGEETSATTNTEDILEAETTSPDQPTNEGDGAPEGTSATTNAENILETETTSSGQPTNEGERQSNAGGENRVETDLAVQNPGTDSEVADGQEQTEISMRDYTTSDTSSAAVSIFSSDTSASSSIEDVQQESRSMNEHEKAVLNSVQVYRDAQGTEGEAEARRNVAAWYDLHGPEVPDQCIREVFGESAESVIGEFQVYALIKEYRDARGDKSKAKACRTLSDKYRESAELVTRLVEELCSEEEADEVLEALIKQQVQKKRTTSPQKEKKKKKPTGFFGLF